MTITTANRFSELYNTAKTAVSQISPYAALSLMVTTAGLIGCPKQNQADTQAHLSEERIRREIKNADKKYEKQKEEWKEDSEAFIGTIKEELDTAACYHYFVRGIRKGPNSTEMYNVHLDEAAAQRTCGNKVEESKASGVGLSSHTGKKTGLEIICTTEEKINCSYRSKEKKELGYDSLFALDNNRVDESLKVSNEQQFVCDQVTDFITNYQYVINEDRRKKQKRRKVSIETVSIYANASLEEKMRPITVDCYSIEGEEGNFCTAGFQEGMMDIQITDTRTCPQIAGLVSEEWVPSKDKFEELPQGIISDIRAGKKIEQENTSEKEKVELKKVQEPEEREYKFSTSILGISTKQNVAYAEPSLFVGNDEDLKRAVFDKLPIENFQYGTSTKKGQGATVQTQMTITAYTPEQLSELKDIIYYVNLFEDDRTKNVVLINIADTVRADTLPARAKIMLYSTIDKKEYEYRQLCEQTSINSNPSLRSFEQHTSGNFLECVVQKNGDERKSDLWGIGTVNKSGDWEHTPFSTQKVEEGVLGIIKRKTSTGTHTLEHLACDTGQSWTVSKAKGEEDIVTFSSEELAQKYHGKKITLMNATDFCSSS